MNGLDYAIVAIYALGFLGLGYFFKENNSSKDYFLGGRSMGWFPLSLSTMATQLSAISFISAPAFVGMKENGGMKWLTYEFGVPIAMAIIMIFLIPTLYKAGIVSVYEYLERRFNASTRLLISFVFQLARSFATGVMVYAIALILQSVLAIEFWQTILVIGVITMIYSFQGGMKAVIWGDVIQMLILFAGIILCLIFGLNELGGWGELTAKVDPTRIQTVDFSSFGFDGEGFGFWPMLFGGIFLYASYYGTDQTQSQRLLSSKDELTIKQLLTVNGLFRYPVTLVYCIMGLVLGTLLAEDPSYQLAIQETFEANRDSLNGPTDLLVPIFIIKYLPHGIIGLLLVAILSAAMSSLSSAINSLSAVTMEDYVKRFNPNMDDATYVRYSRLVSLAWGLICLFLAFFAGNIADTVIEAINKVSSAFSGPILAAFILAIWSKRTTSLSVNIGILAGVAVNIYLWLFVPEVFWFWWNAIGFVVTAGLSLILNNFTGSPHKEFIKTELAIDYQNLALLIGFFVVILMVSLSVPYWFG
ncbi:MAG: sodium:solute symporter [Bacteroidota bacterium]